MPFGRSRVGNAWAGAAESGEVISVHKLCVQCGLLCKFTDMFVYTRGRRKDVRMFPGPSLGGAGPALRAQGLLGS